MPIIQEAIDAYLDRELDSHIWVKKLDRKQVDAALAELDPPPDLPPATKLHQRACFLLGVAFPQFCFWLDMGTGKSLLTLLLLRYWIKLGQVRRAIIFVTSDKAYPTWENQIAVWGIDVPYVSLEGDSKDKWRQLQEFGDGLVIVHYPGAVAMCSSLQTVKRKGKKAVNKRKLDPKLIDAFQKRVDAIVLDESTRGAHHTSLTHDLIRRLGAGIRYALSGRPFGRDPTMLWGQSYLIDGGETLGDTLGLFRAAFFTESDSPFNKYHKDYAFRKRLKAKLSRMVQHRSITYTADECIDLPEFTPIIERVRFTGELEEYYGRLRKTLYESKGNLRAIKNVFLRMRQLSSGFLGFKDDETGERAEIEFGENPKFVRQIELLSEVPEGRKAVIFYEFTHSGRKLHEQIETELDDCIWLWSGTKNPRGEMKRFLTDDRCTFAVINNKLGAFSLDGLQEVANYTFFYESPVSPIDREQAERRLRRQGQRRHVFQYDTIVSGTADQKILDFHREGADLFKALLKDPSRVGL